MARKKTLVFQVYDKDTFSKDDGIGEVQVPLWTRDLDTVTEVTQELAPITRGKDNKPVLAARRPDSVSVSQQSSPASTLAAQRHSLSSSFHQQQQQHSYTGSYSAGHSEAHSGGHQHHYQHQQSRTSSMAVKGQSSSSSSSEGGNLVFSSTISTFKLHIRGYRDQETCDQCIRPQANCEGAVKQQLKLFRWQVEVLRLFLL